MPKIPTKLKLDRRFEGDADKVQNMLDDAYLDIAPNLNRKPDMIIRDRDPNTLTQPDDDSDLGSGWLNSSNGNKFMLTALPDTWTAF